MNVASKKQRDGVTSFFLLFKYPGDNTKEYQLFNIIFMSYSY